MGYFLYKNKILYGEELLPGRPLDRLPEEGEVVCLFHRAPLTGRETFAVSDAALLAAAEGPETLCLGGAGPEIPPELAKAIRAGRVRAVNAGHPRWEELLDPPARKETYRVHLLALGDVGSTLLQGLRHLRRPGKRAGAVGVRAEPDRRPRRGGISPGRNRGR